jgi:large subunit ribosomal protein L23
MALLSKNKKTPRKDSGHEEKKKHSARPRSHASGAAHEIILTPWFSEKALIVTEKGVYTFAVPARATKADVAGAIKEIYKVEPRKIRIVNMPGKAKSMRTRRGEGVRASRHKAYVYLNAGDTIQFA